MLMSLTAQVEAMHKCVLDAETGELIRSHRKLAWRYLTSWFFIDVMTVLPFDLLTVFCVRLE